MTGAPVPDPAADPADLLRRKRRPAKRLTSLELGEISCVDVPANTGAKHLLFKNTAALATTEDPEALAEEVAALRALIAERDQQLAVLADLVATPAPAAAPAAKGRTPTPAPTKAAPSPGKSLRAYETIQCDAAVILAKSGEFKATRGYWLGELNRLGRLMAPDLPPNAQRYAALRDPRGQVLVAALQSAHG